MWGRPIIMSKPKYDIAVVMPCFKVGEEVLDVISKIGSEVSKIYLIDDACPNNIGHFVKKKCKDRRLIVIRHPKNLGVGGSVMTGYKKAIDDNMDIIIKIDGDGQMDPELIPYFIYPITSHEADYTKGNRFFDLDGLSSMPRLRLFGNAALSFLTKLSSGYWDIFDPTNGYTAIHIDVLKRLPLNKISKRFFFESDMLFRLNILKAVVIDIPMPAKYEKEISNISPLKVVFEFFYKNLKNFLKRIFYNYYLRDLSVASFELPLGLGLLLFGTIHGSYNWLYSANIGISTPLGTIMISALSILMGFQLILAFLNADITNTPRRPFQLYNKSGFELLRNKK